jgi:hypothetical protein
MTVLLAKSLEGRTNGATEARFLPNCRRSSYVL